MLPKIEEGIAKAAEQLKAKTNKALGEYQGELPHAGKTGEIKPIKTDELGRVKSVGGELDLSKVDRNTYQQGKAGKTGKTAGIKDGLTDNEGGHLIASIFKGPGEQVNYAAMDGNLNKGAWKRMENKWAEALKGNPPKEVKVEINAIYEGSSKRPVSFEVFYEIDGIEKFVPLKNTPGG